MDRLAVKSQLHNFSDVSEFGYGTVSYLRLENGSNEVNRTFRKELQIGSTPSVFWTDSMTVSKYVANEAKRVHIFVANRVAVILEATDVTQ